MQVNRRLYRCRDNRVIAGVAGGLAEYFDVDPSLVRLFWFLSIFVGGVGVLLYIAMWVIVPLEPLSAEAAALEATNAAEGHRHVNRGSGRVTTVIGLGLIALGGLSLLHSLLPDVSFRFVWPAVIIGFGVLLVAAAMRREQRDEQRES
jgi:phage shock protein C